CEGALRNIFCEKSKARRILQPERVFLPHFFRVGQELLQIIIHARAFNMYLVSCLITTVFWCLIVAHVANRVTGLNSKWRTEAYCLIEYHDFLCGRKQMPPPAWTGPQRWLNIVVIHNNPIALTRC